MPEQPDYRLTFRPKAGQVPPIIRLRQLLKLALRAFGFRCISAEEVVPEMPKSQEKQQQGGIEHPDSIA